jgi:hypothetical protein
MELLAASCASRHRGGVRADLMERCQSGKNNCDTEGENQGGKHKSRGHAWTPIAISTRPAFYPVRCALQTLNWRPERTLWRRKGIAYYP